MTSKFKTINNKAARIQLNTINLVSCCLLVATLSSRVYCSLNESRGQTLFNCIKSLRSNIHETEIGFRVLWLMMINDTVIASLQIK